MPVRSATRAKRDALLTGGQPFVVEPKEVAKATKDYRIDPEKSSFAHHRQRNPRIRQRCCAPGWT
jgi:hypothetical protein